MREQGERALWIFGYGSLVWRPAFRFEARAHALLRGGARRFWQGSTDHRGVPGAPGRVVTLVADPRGQCWGTAYRVAPAHRAEVLAALDGREKGGYRRFRVTLELEGETRSALTYLAMPDNPNYLGPAPLCAIAEQVRRSHGPSGANREYVLCLAEALRAIPAEDSHVFALEALLGVE